MAVILLNVISFLLTSQLLRNETLTWSPDLLLLCGSLERGSRNLTQHKGQEKSRALFPTEWPSCLHPPRRGEHKYTAPQRDDPETSLDAPNHMLLEQENKAK